MKILIVNLGSTSKKYLFFDKTKKEEKSFIFSYKNKKYFFNEKEISKKEFENSFLLLIKILKKNKNINDIFDINYFGIRVVFGFKNSKNFFIKNTKKELEKLKSLNEISKLHNIVSYEVVCRIFSLNKKAKIYLCFDDSNFNFDENYSYIALKEKYKKDKEVIFEKKGFHGISLRYIIRNFKDLTKNNLTNKSLIVCHLGGGSSVSLIKNKKIINSSFLFSTNSGLYSQTRSGNLDVKIILTLVKNFGLKKTEEILNKESGFNSIKKDSYEIFTSLKNKENKLLFNNYINQICNYIFMFLGQAKKIDYIVFSGGTGENSQITRKEILKRISFLIKPKNFVIKVNEEKEILDEILKNL